jgi:hypothetical protein
MGMFTTILVIGFLIAMNIYAIDNMMRMRSDIRVIRRAVTTPLTVDDDAAPQSTTSSGLIDNLMKSIEKKIS